MNLEKYRPQMSQQYPNTAFVEETLDNLKNNRAKLRIPVKKIGKAVGAASLLTAAAFAVLVGVGVMRGSLSEVSITEQNPEEEQANLADREALYTTPLSNPNHNVRISTENGKIALNENTTEEEIIACGGVIDSRLGFVGYERICNFFRAYRNGEAAELVIAELPTAYQPDKRGYQYIGLNEDGTVNGKYYRHDGEYLSTYPFERAGTTTSYGIKFGYCAATSSGEYNKRTGIQPESCSTVAGMALDLSSFGRGGDSSSHPFTRNFIPICTITDLLDVSDRDGDTIREEYFYVLSNLGEKEGVNILWNGQYSTPEQLELFLTRIETGSASYCSTTITDLTKTDEYEECFYALEYLDGTYRIFTMKNGFEGEFHTELFDGYTVEEGMLVFNNGSVEYRFPYVEGALDELYEDVSPEAKHFIGDAAEVGTYYGSLVGGSNWVIRDAGTDSYVWRAASYSNNGGFMLFEGERRFELLLGDPYYFARFVVDPRNCVKIREEYSEGEQLAVEILDQYETASGTVIDITAAPPEKTGEIEVSETTVWVLSNECDIREMPDGKSYLMITEEQWRGMVIKAHTLDAGNQRLSLLVHYYNK